MHEQLAQEREWAEDESEAASNTMDDCAVCITCKVDPVVWPGCSHSFCRSCTFSLLHKGNSQCPLCRSEVGSAELMADVLTGQHPLEPDAAAAACSSAVMPEDYVAQKEANDAAVSRIIEQCRHARQYARDCFVGLLSC